MLSVDDAKRELKKFADSKQAKVLQKFFKTSKGEYGEGDLFLGLKVPDQRRVAKKFKGLGIKETEKLLHSKIHEHRLTALFILVLAYNQSNNQSKIYHLYINNLQYVNNWDLVDSSADKILGPYLIDKPKDILFRLAKSRNLWERRVAIISTFYFIKNERYHTTLDIAEILLQDKHDLIHKAVGWMLREVGNRNLKVEKSFLKKHYKQMPRTMLRYAIEKFPKDKIKSYLKK